MRTRIERAIQEELTLRPKDVSELLRINLKGKRSFHVGDYRIVFALCEECRAEGFTQFNGCKDCRRHGRNDLIIFDVGHRGRIYEEMKRFQRFVP